LNSDSIFQDDQIKEGIPANERFTDAEKKAVEFVNGICRASNETVQKFLETNPQFEGSKSRSSDPDIRPLYMLLDKENEVKVTNKELKLRVKAAARVMDIETLEEAQELIIRLNGKHVVPPATLEECQNRLMDFIDSAEEGGLNAVLKTEQTKDEKINILITKAINADVISFSKEKNQVSKKGKGKGDNTWKAVKMIGSDIDTTERQRLFAEYLATPEGEALREDIEKDLAGLKK
jgi:hypothetical protein